MSHLLKVNYSLFGNKEKGYRRFLYDGYLSANHPDQGIRLVLTAEKLKQLNEKSDRIRLQIEDTLCKLFNRRILPVDRRIILLTAYCFFNAMERAKILLEMHAPERLCFYTQFDPEYIAPANNARAYVIRLFPEIYERALILLLRSKGVEIRFDKTLSQQGGNKNGINKYFSYPKKKLLFLRFKYDFWKELFFFKQKTRQKNAKPLLLILNNYLEAEDIETCRKNADILFLHNWHLSMEQVLDKRIANFSKPTVLPTIRGQWENILDEIPLDDEDYILKESIPLIAKCYPLALIEGRDYTKIYAKRILEKIGISNTDYKRMALSIDHRLWKYESLSGLSEDLIENGGKVVASCHDSGTGLLNYGMTLTVDQCLISHYLGNFKTPFIFIEKVTPKVIQIDSLKRFQPPIMNQKDPSSLSIWYFPHYLLCKPKFDLIFYEMENPESFLWIQKAVVMGLNMIARHPNVKEIVIKLKHHSERTPEKKQYINLIKQLLGENASKKIRFVTDMTMQQALPHISIAVHDFFSGGFVETMYAGLPTLAMLSPEAEIPHRLPYREDWIKSGVFVRNENELYESLLRWIEGKVPPNYDRIKESFLTTCGLGSPTAGQALCSILND